MLKPTDQFWTLLRQVMQYAVDITENYPLLAGNVEVCHIDETVFLEHLYVPWDEGRYERRLADHLLTSLPLLVVASGRGSGKTSALRAACRILEEEAFRTSVEILRLDFSRLFDREGMVQLAPDQARVEFRNLIGDEVRSVFFETPRATKRFLAWLLAGQPDDTVRFDAIIINDLHSISMRAQTEASAEQRSREERYKTLLRWFDARPDSYLKFLQEAEEKLTIAHSALAYCKLRSLKKVIFVYDNVDKIPIDFQTSFIQVAENIQLAMGEYSSSCIAIRTENLYGPWRRADPAGTLINVVLPNDQQYPGVLLPPLQSDHINKVLRNRHVFASSQYMGRFPGSVGVEPSESIHRLIVEEFERNSIHHLTNESVRSITGIYAGFMEYLYALGERELVDYSSFFLRDRDEGHMHTLFYLWLRKFGKNFSVQLYDVLKFKAVSGLKFHERISAHHFLLTCIANLTRQAEQNQVDPPFPELCLVLERMAELGFSFGQLKRALSSMCTVRGGETQTVEFYFSDYDITRITPDSENLIRLTPLGNILISDVFSKAGYVFALAHEYTAGGRKKLSEIAYFDMLTADRISMIFEYVRELATVHLKLMEQLRDLWLPLYGDKWLPRYCDMFGVKGRLQVQRILIEAAKFFAGHFSSRELDNQFDRMETLYGKALEQIEKTEPYARAWARGCGGIASNLQKMRRRERKRRKRAQAD